MARGLGLPTQTPLYMQRSTRAPMPPRLLSRPGRGGSAGLQQGGSSVTIEG